MKTQIYNLLILDKSGSMGSIKEATIAGYNETVQTIKKAQQDYEDSQEHLFSFMAFCGCEKNLIYDKTPIDMVQILTATTYRPCCNTPLYDAMGFCITKLRADLKNKKDYKVLVTVITDGYENASKEYNANSIGKLVEELKGEGWTFTYIGANQDVEKVAAEISINNFISYTANAQGTRTMFEHDSKSRERYFSRIANNNDADLQEDYFIEEKKDK